MSKSVSRAGYVYFIRCPLNGYIKIGHTDRAVAARFTQLRAASPVPIEVVGTIDGTKAAERRLHVRFVGSWSHGEWFRPDPEVIEFVEREAKPWVGGKQPSRHIVSRLILPDGSRRETVAEWAARTMITFRGETRSATDWAKLKNLTIQTIKIRMEKGVITENLFLRALYLGEDPVFPDMSLTALHAKLDARIAEVASQRAAATALPPSP